MVNAFYNASGAPVTASPGASATIRAEFAAIAAGFDKLPSTLAANKAVIVNAGGTGLTTTTGNLALGGNLTLTNAFNLEFIQSASISLTTPAASGQLITRTSTDTLTNKTLTSPVMTAPQLGTPASGVLTNCTGLPVATGISGLGTDVATALAASLNGTGALSATTNCVFVTPQLGTPQSGVLTNCTGLPVTTGISGLGTGVATLLAGTPSGTTGVAGTASPTFTGTVTTAALTTTGLFDISGASAGQIKFPASPNLSSNANTLDDYQEQTFTPVLRINNGTTGITYTTQAGSYTKIGNRIFFEVNIVLSNKGALTGNVIVDMSAIPYLPSKATTPTFYAANVTISGAIEAAIEIGSLNVLLYGLGVGVPGAFQETNISNTSRILLSGSFPA